MREIVLVLLDANRQFVGYKNDSFWSLTDKKAHAKQHEINENNQIATHLLPNLEYFANGGHDKVAKEKLYGNNEKLYIAAEEIGSYKRTILYSFHRSDMNINGIVKPWQFDVDIK